MDGVGSQGLGNQTRELLVVLNSDRSVDSSASSDARVLTSHLLVQQVGLQAVVVLSCIHRILVVVIPNRALLVVLHKEVWLPAGVSGRLDAAHVLAKLLRVRKRVLLVVGLSSHLAAVAHCLVLHHRHGHT